MEKKKLLVIFPKKPGGEYIVTKNLCRKIKDLPKLAIEVEEIETPTFNLGKKFRFLKQVILNLLISFRVLRKISSDQAEKINYIYSPSPFVLFLVFFFRKFRKAKAIYHFHGFDYGEDDKNFWQYLQKEKMNLLVKYCYFLPILSFYFFLVNLVLRKCWRVFVPAHYSSSLILSKYHFLAEKKLVVVPNGYDQKVFFPPRTLLLPKHHKVLYVGRLAKEKGIEELIKAFDLLDDEKYCLTLICSSTSDGEFEGVIKRLLGHRSNVEIFMNLSPKRVADYYRRSDLTVLPSKTSFEQFPLVYLESLACATPMLISEKIPGILSWQEAIAPGLIIKEITPNGIAPKIKDFFQLSDRERNGIKDRCLGFAKNYNWENSVKILADALR